jgi:hypothetical protein
MLTAVDVETVYAEFPKVLGGSHFLNGNPVTDSTPTLDYRNFATNAGINNAHKATPRTYFGVELRFASYTGGSGGKNVFSALPGYRSLPEFATDFQAFGFSLMVGAVSNTTNSTNITVSYVRNGTPTTIDSSTLTNTLGFSNAIGNNITRDFAPVVLYQNDQIRLQISSNVNLTDVVGVLYIKTMHVK